MSVAQNPLGTAAALAPDAVRFEILNAIYLRKMATAAHVAEVTGQPPAVVEQALSEEAAADAVLGMDGAWLLQEAGTAKVLAFYSQTYAPLREEAGIMAWYERFETALNQQFIKAVSDWQTSGGDARAQEKMGKLVERMMRALGQITAEIPRYQRYVDRFARAMSKADQGQSDFVCRPVVDSMHNIWFEFHEDILAVVGRPRDV